MDSIRRGGDFMSLWKYDSPPVGYDTIISYGTAGQWNNVRWRFSACIWYNVASVGNVILDADSTNVPWPVLQPLTPITNSIVNDFFYHHNSADPLEGDGQVVAFNVRSGQLDQMWSSYETRDTSWTTMSWTSSNDDWLHGAVVLTPMDP